ncbi:MAG: hypothetical protein IJG51_11855 [Synergistaceae bacterium]|nr:hypothetical protein [Synergistaceae bacterium]MBQ6665889.1 hypothetical protein [Synergistaceae bacterium]
MIIGQELEERGDDVMLLNHINTDDAERENWKQLQCGRGFIRDAHGKVAGRLVAQIPVEEAAMLEAQKDIDYLSFSRNGDKNAFRRLLARFPYWRCAEGGI